jgi:hypothetical protein
LKLSGTSKENRRNSSLSTTEYHMLINTAIREYDSETYIRVELKRNKVLVKPLIELSKDDESHKVYKGFDDLPDDIKGKVSLLLMLDFQSQQGREVEGVGIRVSENIFWVSI